MKWINLIHKLSSKKLREYFLKTPIVKITLILKM